jgi:hypothetical protein
MFSSPKQPRFFLLWAFVLSALLHLGVFSGVPRFSWEVKTEQPPPLQARLLPAEHDAPVPVRAQPEVPAKPKPKPVPEEPIGAAPPPAPAPPIETAKEIEFPAQQDVDAVVPILPPGKSIDASYPFRSIDMQFEIHYGEPPTLVGRMDYRWSYEEGRYLIESKMETVGFVSLFYGRTHAQRSGGTLNVRGLKPEYYLLQQSGKPDERVDFDWDRSNARLQRGNKRTELVLQPGTQDLLSVLHQIHFIRPLQQSNPLYIATPKHIETNIVELLGEENLESPIGPIRSLHLKYRDPDGGVVEFWLDQDRALLPVRIHSENRKDVILDYRLRAISVELID